MLYVINASFGGFAVPDEVADILHCGRYAFDCEGDIRTDPTLIDWVIAHLGKTPLALVDIPDYATDWEMDEYDGLESVIAVIDGKIVHLPRMSAEDLDEYFDDEPADIDSDFGFDPYEGCFTFDC